MNYVPALDTPARQLERLITMKTAECEGIEETGELLAGACVARVEAVEPIAGSHNVKAVVDDRPLRREDRGLRRAQLPRGHDHGLCPARQESDQRRGKRRHAGQRRRTRHQSRRTRASWNCRAGGRAAYRCLPDSIIEIDNKSITHRPDLWGHYGMAREVAAITGQPLRDPVRAVAASGGAGGHRKSQIEDLDLCPRYSALVFENVTVQPSPLWLQYRLTAIGLNPINNIVDVTNYVMAELAQPMHAFDRAICWQGDTIFVRRARAERAVPRAERRELHATNHRIW